MVGEGEFDENDACIIVDQICKDATYGTFGDFPKTFWESIGVSEDTKEEIKKCVSYTTPVYSDESKKWKCLIKISNDMFEVENNGLQHLIGILAGDLFNFSLPQYKIIYFNVIGIEFDKLKSEAYSIYRENKAHSIVDIREKFNLKPEEPLLAFSIKPRVGLDLTTFERLACLIASQGFHIIEFDTRHLCGRPEFMEAIIEIANKVADEGKQIGIISRLSPNCSFGAQKAQTYVNEFTGNTPYPWVIKIDGNLDGISTCQSIRKDWHDAQQRPIITSYPLLKSTLANSIGGGNTFIDILAVSGVDVIYPGNCPRFEEKGCRKIDSDALKAGQDHYKKMLSAGWPMPTVAGGVHAGELHAYYELLGPKVAYFIGGGVSLHKDGPVAGAHLCRTIINEAIKTRSKIAPDDDIPPLKEKYWNIAAEYFCPKWMDNRIFEYLPPQNVFEGKVNLKPFFSEPI